MTSESDSVSSSCCSSFTAAESDQGGACSCRVFSRERSLRTRVVCGAFSLGAVVTVVLAVLGAIWVLRNLVA